MITNQVLLASHGSEGAIAAENMAFSMCSEGGKIHHVIVVPDLWKGMMGDDWLNNGVTRDRFGNYLEAELESEVQVHVDRVRDKAEKHKIDYSSEIVVGKPDKCLIDASRNAEYDLVVMGSPRPKGKSGLNSRMRTEPLTRSLTIPLMIAPYPYA